MVGRALLDEEEPFPRRDKVWRKEERRLPPLTAAELGEGGMLDKGKAGSAAVGKESRSYTHTRARLR